MRDRSCWCLQACAGKACKGEAQRESGGKEDRVGVRVDSAWLQIWDSVSRSSWLLLLQGAAAAACSCSCCSWCRCVGPSWGPEVPGPGAALCMYGCCCCCCCFTTSSCWMSKLQGPSRSCCTSKPPPKASGTSRLPSLRPSPKQPQHSMYSSSCCSPAFSRASLWLSSARRAFSAIRHSSCCRIASLRQGSSSREPSIERLRNLWLSSFSSWHSCRACCSSWARRQQPAQSTSFPGCCRCCCCCCSAC